MSRSIVQILLVLVSPWIPAVEASRAPPRVPEAVRRDWYFRESLRAIRDWEKILARGDATPEPERAPRFPVPSNGEEIEWPNPIPRSLLPSRDLRSRLRARVSGGKVDVTLVSPEGKMVRKAVAPGEAVVGYRHPGGGGKDHWYHAYHRRFDRLATFRPEPAPFALRLAAPGEIQRGPNEIAVAVRNVEAEPLALTLRLSYRSPREDRDCGSRSVALAGGARETLSFSVDLRARGGGLLVLAVEVAGDAFWIPLLTHVEDVAAVLDGIERILADAPHETSRLRLAELRRHAAEFDEASPPREGWRTLFEAASAMRDELLLRRIDFDTLLFVKRKPFDSEQPFMDAHHLRNRPGGGIYRLAPVRPWGRIEPVVDTLGQGIYRDICLHWSGEKFLFSFGNGSDRWDGKQSYHIYEVGAGGEGLRQLTSGPKNDCEPFYLPNGQLGFTSDRSEHFVMCGGNRHSPNLYVMDGDGSDVRQLSFNVFNDFNPTVLPDGRILYSRWEYNERSVTSLHNPFTVNPDGTMMAPYYGNATIRPNVVMFPRPVAGSDKVMALFTAHHGQTHGAIGLIDVKRGIDGPEPITLLTPGVPVTGEKAEDSLHGWYSDPAPLTETTYLCSFTPTVLPWLERSWALYVGDRHGNLALAYRDPEISCAEPVPLVSRPRPHVMPAAPRHTDAEDAEATLLLLDVYIGLAGVPRGEARYLRILEDVPRKSVRRGGVICTSGTSIYTIKRVFGTVPIEPDGSAHFVVPANRNVYFEVLDEKRREIQRMRSVVCLKPNEERTCIGCHEPRSYAPPNLPARAALRAASRPAPPPWGARTLSFLRDIQPLLNDKCAGCHTHDRMKQRVILTDDLTDRFAIGYEELLPYLEVANAMRWDHPDDVYPRPPYTYGSRASRLMKLLEAGHHGVELGDEDWQRLAIWIDANGVYYDRYEADNYDNRRIFTGSVVKAMKGVYARRCSSCHGGGDGRHDTWWLSLNRRHVAMSRGLQAPLSREAGGWGRCDERVFLSSEDPDYRLLLRSLTELRETLQRRPRADLASIRGTEAERQKVTLPEPPPPGHAEERELPPGDWVDLSSLTWVSGRAGWTPTKDGLPRLDRDVQGGPLRLGFRRYRRGIGTHAPSEIVYRLDGGYLRLMGTVGGAERGGTVVFRVLGDGKALYDSGVMRGLREVKQLDVSVAEVEELRLTVTDAGDGYFCDMANWADVRLLRAGGGGGRR